MSISLPKSCPRKRSDCQPLSQILAENNASFFCCGENDGTTRKLEQDKYTFCFRNDSIDEMSHNDQRDLTHTATTILNALSVIEERKMA